LAAEKNQGTSKENLEMKLLRCLPLIATVCMLSGIAKADPVDFHMVVVDPPTPSNPTFSVTDITSSPVIVSFTDTCSIDGSSVPTFDGCAAFINGTGSALTSLDLDMPNSGLAANQMPNCSTSGTGTDFFSSAFCPSPAPGADYIIDFSGGSIPPDTYFVIAESGVDVSTTPWTGTLTTTPEPSSIWLLSTGVLLLGGFFFYKRRNSFGEIGF
jgi:hypothetical protein